MFDRKAYDRAYRKTPKRRAYVREWERQNRSKRSSYRRKYYRKLKHWVVNELGRKCQKCSLVSEFDCIYDLHHTEDSIVEKWINSSTLRAKLMAKWRRKNQIPEGIVLLCANCHRIVHFNHHM